MCIFKLFFFHSFRCTPNPITDTSFNVKGLVKGHPYEFRVAAVNEAGPGQYAETSEAIKPAPPPSELNIPIEIILTALVY